MSSSKQYFDELGAGWDTLQPAFFSEAVRERAFEVAAIQRGRVAADLGAGTGFVTVGLLGHELRVIAVDQSQPMLDALRGKCPDTDALDCRLGDAEHIPIEDASVDYCFANMCLHHVEHPARAVAEMVRILRPGGRLVITDLDSHDHAFLLSEHHDRWMGFERDQIRRWFGEAGLEAVSIDGIGEQCCTTACDGERASISIFVASGKRPGAVRCS